VRLPPSSAGLWLLGRAGEARYRRRHRDHQRRRADQNLPSGRRVSASLMPAGFWLSARSARAVNARDATAAWSIYSSIS